MLYFQFKRGSRREKTKHEGNESANRVPGASSSERFPLQLQLQRDAAFTAVISSQTELQLRLSLTAWLV